MLRVVSFILLLMIVIFKYKAEASPRLNIDGRDLDHFKRTFMNLVHQRIVLLKGLNDTAVMLPKYLNQDSSALSKVTGDGRGMKKKLKQMNKTLMAIVMAYTFKFMFLVPSFVGTLVLLKFTAGLAGFFFALFAAVLGLDRHDHHH